MAEPSEPRPAIASKMGAYEKLNVEQEFATQMLTAANTALEQARTESQKQQFYLERVVQPNKPDEATLPHRLEHILAVFVCRLCVILHRLDADRRDP